MSDPLVMRAELRILQKEVADLEDLLRIAEENCTHQWVNTMVLEQREKRSVPLIVQYDSCPRNLFMGEHMLSDKRTVSIPKYVRTCSICGKEESTYVVKPSGFMPDFAAAGHKQYEPAIKSYFEQYCGLE